MIDPGHGGVDNGTQSGDETEKNLVLGFGLALRDRLEKKGKYRVVMTRTDDTFIPLAERVRIARNQSASLFVSIHADALPHEEGDAQGATIYTLSDRASDTQAEQLAEAENKADAIGGVNLTEEPTDVADILIDLAQRETRTYSNRFARVLMGEMKIKRSDAQASAEVCRLQGFEGSRCSLGPDRARLCLEQGRSGAPRIGELAFQNRGDDCAGDRYFFCQAPGDRGNRELKPAQQLRWKPQFGHSRAPIKKLPRGLRIR